MTTNRLLTELNYQAKHNADLLKLIEIYPDLDLSINRWGDRRYTTSLNRESVKYIDYGFSCSCCPDPTFIISAFELIGDIKVFYRPEGTQSSQVAIGEQEFSSDKIILLKDWENVLSKIFPQHIINKTRDVLNKQYGCNV